MKQTRKNSNKKKKGKRREQSGDVVLAYEWSIAVGKKKRLFSETAARPVEGCTVS